MSEKDNFDLSAEELRQMKYETFISEIKNIVAEKSPPEKSKSKWQSFFESSAGTAVITIVLGGIAGGLITGIFQNYSKEREQSLLAYQQFLTNRQSTTVDTYGLVGTSFAAADNLIRFKLGPGNDDSEQTQPEVKKELIDEKKSLFSKFTEARQKWTAEREKSGLLLSLFYSENKEVQDSWKKVDNSITKFLNYSEDCFNFNNCDESENLKSQLGTEIDLFGIAIGKASDQKNAK